MPAGVRVSVIVPVHNAAAYVGPSVHSALASDLHELEVIVVDDGSDDNSAAVVAEIADPRIDLLRMPPSGGPSRPRNAGIARARAPYVAFLDSDDVLKSDKLSRAVSALDRFPEAGFAFTDFESIDERGTLLQKSVLREYLAWPMLTADTGETGWRLIPQKQLARALVYENFVGTSGVVVRGAFLQEVGAFDESLNYSEDRDLWFRLAHRSSALFSGRVGHSYRVRPGSLTGGPQVRNATARIRVLQRERQRWSWHEWTIQRQLDRLVAANFAAIGYEERSNRRLRAIAMFARAFAASPQLRWLRGMLGSVVN